MSQHDIIILKDQCPKHHLNLWAHYSPSGFDEDGHADEIDLDDIACPTCGTVHDDKLYERAKDLIYDVHTRTYSLMHYGDIWQEL